MDISIISELVPIYSTGLGIGMLLALSAGIGGITIHYVSKIFKIVGG